MERLLARDLIDPDTEIHYAYHRSITSITKRHSHDFYEIFLVTKGSLIHEINGDQALLETGDLVFIRPDDVHCYEKNGVHVGELLNLAFTASLADAIFGFLGDGLDRDALLASPMPQVQSIGPHHMARVRGQLHEISMLPGIRKKQVRSEIRVLLAELFASFFSGAPEDETASLPVWLAELAEEMRLQDNFALGLPRLYELSGRSPEHVTRVIKKCFGKTPTEWVNEIRLQYAANLLAHTDDSILSISLEAGYENLSHFYHLFKARYDCTPARYRQGNRKVAIPVSKPAAAALPVARKYQNSTKRRSV